MAKADFCCKLGQIFMFVTRCWHRMEFELAQRHFREGLRMDPEHPQCKKHFRTIKKMEVLVNPQRENSVRGWEMLQEDEMSPEAKNDVCAES